MSGVVWMAADIAGRDEKNNDKCIDKCDRIDRKPGLSLEDSKNSDDLHPAMIPLPSLSLSVPFHAIGQPR